MKPDINKIDNESVKSFKTINKKSPLGINGLKGDYPVPVFSSPSSSP